MTINTSISLAILPIRARIQSRQVGDSFVFLVRSWMIVFECTFVFDAGTAEVVVIAEFVVGGTLFDSLKDFCVDF